MKDSKNQSVDIQAALQTVKEQNEYLFESESKSPVFSKPTPGAAMGGMDAIRAAAGLTNKNNEK